MKPDPMRIRELFVAAVAKADPEQREAFLQLAGNGDDALVQEVRVLLEAHDDVGTFLDSPAVPPYLTRDPWPLAEGPGTVVGAYTLIEPIGEGGMGVVYLAEQTRPMRRKVALKIIKPGMDTRQVVARFEAERQALAMMDHPNIARVHDGGRTESGRPYFVMELVRGTPITDYCDSQQLSVTERLELFVLVCRAVQHAHQKGIIHRDLKPSNILVTVIDGAAVPKIIDFGVAKATGASLTDQTLHTGFHQLIGTPLYMSPEQLAFSGVDVDTRSDIYSLGVLLYELLTGTTPFDRESLHTAAFDEMRRIIREEEPPRPSTRLGKDLPTTPTRLRASSSIAHPSSIRELDWIVMKALEKDRQRRYATANDLAADVLRCLSDQPVEAGPPSAWYRIGKSVRRHQLALMTAGMVSLALIVGTVVSIGQAIRATRAEGRMAAALDEAKGHRLLAERHLYAALLRQAHQAIDRGQVEQAQDILDSFEDAPHEGDPRGFAWHYLNSLARRELIQLRTNGQAFREFALSPDGRTLAIEDTEKRIGLWELATLRRRADLTGTTLRATEPRFSPDGQRLIALEVDHRGSGQQHYPGAILWDVASGRLLTRLREGQSGGTFRTAEFAGSHSVLVHEVADPDRFQHWSLQPDPTQPRKLGSYLTGSLKRYFPAAGTLIHEDGGPCRVWDPDTGTPGVELEGIRLTWNHFMGWSDDGRIVAVSFGGERIALWDAATGRELEQYPIKAGPIRQILFTPDARYVAARDDLNGRIHLRDRSLRRSLTMQVDDRRGPGRTMRIAFSRDSRSLAVHCWGNPGGASPVAQWNLATGRRQRVCPGIPQTEAMSGLAFTPDDRFLIYGGSGAIKLWRLATAPPIALAGHRDEAWAVAFSPDGRILASGSDDTEDDETIKLWDPATGNFLRGWRTGEGTISALAFSPEGRVLASAALGKSGNLRLWDVETGRAVISLDGHNDYVRSVAFSPDGALVASAGTDCTVRLWDARGGRLVSTLWGHADIVRKVAFSPDGHTLASASNDQTVRLWSVATGKLMRVIPTLQKCAAVAFSPDGSLLASGDEIGGIAFWDPKTGERRRLIPSDHDQLLTLAFSPDGRTLAAAGLSRIIKIWDVLTGQELLTLPGHNAQINGLAFAPEGRTLASCSHDGAVKLWRSEDR